MSVFDYAFEKPVLTELTYADVRLPEDKEIILVRGISEKDYRNGQVGRLILKYEVMESFRDDYTNWHYDFAQVQTHLTVQGRCRVRTSALLSKILPTPEIIPILVPDIVANALEVDIEPGDMIMFRGSEGRNPIFHEVTTTDSPRKSLLSLAIRTEVT